MAKYVTKSIDDLGSVVDSQIRTANEWNESGASFDQVQYDNIRNTFNIQLLAASIGAEFKATKKKPTEFRPTGIKPLPNLTDRIKIRNIYRLYIDKVESVYLAKSGEAETKFVDPKTGEPVVNHVKEIEKLSNKKFSALIQDILKSKTKITEDDLELISAMAETLRIKNIVKFSLVILGLVFVVTGGIVLVKALQDNDDTDECTCSDNGNDILCEIEYDDAEYPMVTYENNDIPRITIEDE